MTTLVTGGAGFIGSHVAERLLQQGQSVVVIDNFNDYYDPAIKRENVARLKEYDSLTVIDGDIRDQNLLADIFTTHDIQRVAHLAAMASVRVSIERAPLYIDVNVVGTTYLLEAARKHGVTQFVLASTSSVYGKTDIIPFIETDTADRPLASYPASKRSAEIIAYSYTHLFNLPVTVVRFFNVYGPAGRPDMMPLRMMNAINNGDPVPIFNKGNIERDWTYIDDTVSGVCAALERTEGYEIINLGVGQPISLNAFIEAIESLAGKELIRQNVDTPPSEAPITYCNNDKARRLLGFDPQTTVFEGIEKTWAWFLSQR